MPARKKTSHNYFEDFREVLLNQYEKDGCIGTTATEAMERIVNFYGLSPFQVLLLSAFLINGGNIALEDVMSQIKAENAMGEAFEALICYRILRIRTSGSGKRELYVNEGDVEAFKKGKPMVGFELNGTAAELRQMSQHEVFAYDRAMDLEFTLALKTARALDAMSVPDSPMKEAFAFWALCHQMVHCFMEPFVLEKAESALKDSDCSMGDLKIGMMKLVKDGIAQIVSVPDGDKSVAAGFILSPKVAGIVFHGTDHIVRYEGISEYATVVKHTDIESRELFFTGQSQSEVDHLRKILSRKGYERACRILKAQKRNPSIQSLFYGPPGTGKTEVIRQIARETKRDLIFFDTAKVTFSEWGATEKAYRELFRCYRYIAEICGSAPILVMNEADQLLSRRITYVDSSMEKSQNIITDLLLEEMENMKGILLATTNLKDNIDQAFDRRFLFRTELTEPDAEARMLIWKSLLKKVPDEEARILAEEYVMSGAQISNVVVKRNLAELYYDGDRGLDFIRGLCDQELSSMKQHKADHVRVGF